MNSLERAYWTIRALGWDNVPRRIGHLAKNRLGVPKRVLPGGELPPEKLQRQFTADYNEAQALDRWRDRAGRFLFSPADVEALRGALPRIVDEDLWQTSVRRLVEQLPRGQLEMFHRFSVDAGWPVRFNRDPLHGVSWPTGRHWSDYGHFNAALKDIKCVWEASRFSVAYALARDHVRGNQRAAGLFWQLFRSWDEQNPYGLTPQWMCGQEATFRLMAWLFAACAMIDHDGSAPADYARLTQLAWYTGRHIDGNINYARSQKNNHGVSEAVGLWTIGLLFPEIRSAARWAEKGRRILIAEIRRQVYSDGSYVQHSVNYHRVMLDDCLWAWRLGQTAGQPLDEIRGELDRAVEWLWALVDPATGRAPNYGANDGASVLPLACCDYLDHRPVLQAAHYLLHGRRCYPPGPWDEKMAWFAGTEALDADVPAGERPRNHQAPEGGYYTTGGPRSWAMTRIHAIKDRPPQADMLHLDLWYAGVNVLRDGGTYHYFTDPPWQHFFESTAGHNTVEIDGQDQMVKGPRFLWLRWTQSRVNSVEHTADGQASYIEGEHYGYTRLTGRVVHRRGILRLSDSYVVVDDLLGDGEHSYALRWRLCDAPWGRGDDGWSVDVEGQRLSILVHAPAEAREELLRGQAGEHAEGWESLYYAEKEPAPTIVTRGRASLPIRLVTVISPSDSHVRVLESGSPDDPVVLANRAGGDMASLLKSLSCVRFAVREMHG